MKTYRRSIVALLVVVSGVAAVWAAGTALSLVFDTPVVTCTQEGGAVAAGYTVTTTGADAAIVNATLSLNGAEVKSDSHTIAAGNVATGGGWTFAGRTKTYDGTFSASGLADGIYTLEICATQNGANGNPNKAVCQSETIEVNCGGAIASNCSNAPFGEVVGNHHIGVDATAQVNFRGNFGESASLLIVGPNGFSTTASIAEDGNSCNYHANWKFSNGNGANIYGNSGPGDYTLTVTGNGQTLIFFVTLIEK